MIKISGDIISFFNTQGFVIASTIDKNGSVHNACKGVVKIDPAGQLFLLDLYKGKTITNLRDNPHISLTVVDEHNFRGYCLKGYAEIIDEANIKKDLIKAWEDKITSRLTQRLLNNIRAEKKQVRHPEIMLPKPKYMISVKIEEMVDLTPGHLK